VIELKNLSCSYERKIILEDISLKIPQHLTILGANGAGKSTLAKAICSLIEYEGEILLDDADIKKLKPKERAKLLAYIPAKLELYDAYITLFEFVLLGRFPFKKNLFDYSKEDRDIVRESLEFLHLSHLSKHSLNSLSSGESQLALIAQALTQKSRIIIFDEPTANLDPKNSKIIAQQIKMLQKSREIILITHDIHLAKFIDAPIAFIKEKKLLYFEQDFFEPQTLSKLYEVEFDALAVKYD